MRSIQNGIPESMRDQKRLEYIIVPSQTMKGAVIPNPNREVYKFMNIREFLMPGWLRHVALSMP